MPETTSTKQELKSIDVREIGNTGLKHLQGVIAEECNKELRYPYAVNTFKRMLKDPVVASSIELIEGKIASAPWRVTFPESSPDLKEKAKLIEQMLFYDMEGTFESFIRQAATMYSFGFAPFEKVFRYRNYEYGSRYNDGFIGIKKLAFRSQDSIAKWKFDKGNKNVLGLYQYSVKNGTQFSMDVYSTVSRGGESNFTSTDVEYIPSHKFINFVNNPYKDSPVGNSPLLSAYIPWKYKEAYLKTEAAGVSKESHGIKTLLLPPAYMEETATPEMKKAFAAYQQVMKNIDLGNSSSMILPMLTDPSGNKMFELKVENLTGSSSYNINEIIERYNNEIYACLFASVLPLGSAGGGSHALSESKMNLVDEMVKSKLDIIKSVINKDLIPHIFRLNNWPTEVLPTIEYGNTKPLDLQAFSAAIQRIKAVGVLPITVETVNWVLREIGCPYTVPEGTTREELTELLGDATSKSGASFNTPTGGLNGTAKSVDSDDNTISNKENK